MTDPFGDLFVKATEYGLWEDTEPMPVDELCQRIKDREDEESYLARQIVVERTKRKAKEETDKAEECARVFRVQCLSEIQDEETTWLWANRIPLADFTIVGGRAGIGKSLFLCTLAAWITTGDIRGQFDGTPRNVIFIANEDSYARTVVPRLKAAGADLTRIYRVDVTRDGEGELLMLPRDLEKLRRVCADTDAVAVIIDPVSSNMTDKDRNSPDVRKSYERLRTFAETSGTAVVGNGHLKKGAFKDFLEGFMGSSEIGNVARAAIGIALDPDAEERTVILSQCKNNNGPMDLKSYTYQVKTTQYSSAGGLLITAPMLVWGESTTDKHVNDILAEPLSLDSKSDVQECREWLSEYLQRSPGMPRRDVIKEAAKHGYKEHTVKRAARAVAVSRPAGTFPNHVVWEPKPRSAQ